MCEKGSNKASAVKHSSGNHSGLSLGVACAFGWGALKKPSDADSRRESEDAVLGKLPVLTVSSQQRNSILSI